MKKNLVLDLKTLVNGVIKSFTNMCYEGKLIDYNLLTEEEKEWLNKFEVM